MLRSKNGGEYISKEFDTFCEEARFKRELTVHYNLQQNRVADSKNRSIIETTKAMALPKETLVDLSHES